MKKIIWIVGALAILILVAGCGPKITVSTDTHLIRQPIGDMAMFKTTYTGEASDPQVLSICENFVITNNTLDNGTNTITTKFRINDYHSQKNCFQFSAGETVKKIGVAVEPQQQAQIQEIEFLQKIVYDRAERFKVSISLEPRAKRESYQVRIFSQTPNMKYVDEQGDVSNLNAATLNFTTGEYQDSAAPSGLIMVPNPGYSSVDLQPISFKLYMHKEGQWYLIDEQIISGRKAVSS